MLNLHLHLDDKADDDDSDNCSSAGQHQPLPRDIWLIDWLLALASIILSFFSHTSLSHHHGDDDGDDGGAGGGHQGK